MKSRILFLALLLCLFLVYSINAQTSAFSYQGRLTNNSAAANGTYNMKFRLYDSDAVSANQISAEIPALVTVVNGIFSINLDFGANSFAATGERWLEIEVNSTILTPRQKLTASPFAVRALNANTADTATNAANADKLGGLTANQYALKTDTAPNSFQLGGVNAGEFVQKSGGTLTGTLNLPADGLTVGTNQLSAANGKIGVGKIPGDDASETVIHSSSGFTIPCINCQTVPKLVVQGSISITGGDSDEYTYKTPKTRYLSIPMSSFISVNPTVYQGRIDDGTENGNVNGLGGLWAIGGENSKPAYFVAPVNLPDGAEITVFTAGVYKETGGPPAAAVELYRTDASLGTVNTAQLIARVSTEGSLPFVVVLTAQSIDSRYNLVNNRRFQYFVRYTGETNNNKTRFNWAQIIYNKSYAD